MDFNKNRKSIYKSCCVQWFMGKFSVLARVSLQDFPDNANDLWNVRRGPIRFTLLLPLFPSFSSSFFRFFPFLHFLHSLLSLISSCDPAVSRTSLPSFHTFRRIHRRLFIVALPHYQLATEQRRCRHDETGRVFGGESEVGGGGRESPIAAACQWWMQLTGGCFVRVWVK